MVQVVCNTYTSNDENITNTYFPFELSYFLKNILLMALSMVIM